MPRSTAFLATRAAAAPAAPRPALLLHAPLLLLFGALFGSLTAAEQPAPAASPALSHAHSAAPAPAPPQTHAAAHNPAAAKPLPPGIQAQFPAANHPTPPVPLRGMNGENTPASTGSLDAYLRAFYTSHPLPPPEFAPFYRPFSALAPNIDPALFANPDDPRSLEQAAEYLPGTTEIDGGALGLPARVEAMGTDPADSLWTLDGSPVGMPDGSTPFLGFAGYRGVRLTTDRYAAVWHPIGAEFDLAVAAPSGGNLVDAQAGAGNQGVWTQSVAADFATAAANGTVGEETEQRKNNSHANSFFRRDSEWLRLDLPVAPAQTLTLTGQRMAMSRGFYDSNNFGLGSTDDPNDRQSALLESATIDSLWQPRPNGSFDVGLSALQEELTNDQIPDNTSATSQVDRTTLTRVTGRTQMAWQATEHDGTRLRLTGSIVGVSERYHRPFKSIDRQGQTGLASLAAELGNPDALLFDMDLTALTATDIGGFALPGVTMIVPLPLRSGVPEERLEWRSGYSRGLRQPSYEQRYLNDLSEVGNRDLKAEQADIWSTGLDYTSPFLSAQARYQYRRYIDPIVVDSTTFPFTWRNAPGANLRAVNVSLRSFPVPAQLQPTAWRMPAFFDWTWVQGADGFGAALLDRPRNDLKAGLELDLFAQRHGFGFSDLHPEVAAWTAPYWLRAGAQWHYRSGWLTDLNQPPLGAFYTLDGFLSLTPWQPTPGNGSLELRFDARNLTDQRALSDLGFLEEGLTWTASVHVQWHP
ncbi:MAG: TonB-dependent receptor domain-containing protein [Planctomycetota bacterium]